MWTLKDKGLRPTVKVNLPDAVPSYAHMALATLMDQGYLKFVVSTNCDGLHWKSGIPQTGLAELHGNIFKEICPTCGAEHMRPFDGWKTFYLLISDI